jgi:membrane-bound lytic murein transglycosylase A
MTAQRRTCFLALFFCFQIAAAAAAAEEPQLEIDSTNYRTPLKAVALVDYPTFNDDYDFNNMKMAIDRQLARFKQKSLKGTIRMGTKTYPLSKAAESLQAFSALIDQFNDCVARAEKSRCYEDFNLAIRRQFDVYVPNLVRGDPRYGNDNFARFTGYNTMRVNGSLEPTAEFPHAIYESPSNSKLKGKTRVQIDFGGAISGMGYESLFTDQLYDIYLIQVQGSGVATVRQPDGTSKDIWLQYDGTNGQRWEFISLYMAKKGYIVNGSIPSQRKFMRDNPAKAQEIFANCPSYVYLKASDKPPTGSDSVAVTQGRTLATDTAYYPFKGLLTYVEATRPTENGNYNLDEEDKSKIPFSNFSRFFLDQDTGGAIQGKARADIYFGADDYAFFAGMHEDQLGKIHYLMLK